MCFNETASLAAFSTGMLFCAILYVMGYPIFYISMLFFITIMQIVEYFTHKSITTGNIKMNELCTKIILITLFIQPIMYCYMGMYHSPSKQMINTKLYSPLMLVYVLFFIFMYLYFDAHRIFKTTYLDKCDTVCRLKWLDLKGFAGILGVIFVVLYMAVFIDFGVDPRFKYKWAAHFVPICLVIASIYSLTLSNYSIFSKMSYMGSLWCFLAVSFGPIMLLTYKL
jgi:hypothetical protein